MRALQMPTEPPPPAGGPVVGTRAPLPDAALLAGVVPAEGRRRWAHLIDAGIALLAGILTVIVAGLVGFPGWTMTLLGVIAVGLAVGGVLLQLIRVGHTPGLRWLGLRVVERATALPPHLGRPRGGLLAADLRSGRDPLRLQPSQTAVTATSETGRWQDLGESRRHVVRLTIDDGTTFTLSGPTLIGRDPVPPAGSDWEVHAIPDLTRTISKNHALLEPVAEGVQVTDLGSVNGTTVLTRDGLRHPLTEGIRVSVPSGGRLAAGSRLVLIATEKEGTW